MEKNLLSANYAYLIDAAGEYVTVSDSTPSQPRVAPNATLPARSSGRDVFSRGRTQSLVSPKSSLIVR